jgi:protein gp37
MFISEPTFNAELLRWLRIAKLNGAITRSTRGSGARKSRRAAITATPSTWPIIGLAGEWGPHGKRKRTSDDNWRKPLRWAKDANGHRPRVFCASLADWLDNKVPREWRSDLGRLIEDTPELDWLLLTKRPENYEKLAPWDVDTIPSNVWFGVTCEDQPHYERRWAILSRARIRATVKFISYEPALGPLSKLQLQPGGGVPDWIICGGESGTDARRIKPAWVRAVRDECADLGIAFFMKQIGDNHYGWPTNIRGKGQDMDEWPEDLRLRQFPSGKRAY